MSHTLLAYSGRLLALTAAVLAGAFYLGDTLPGGLLSGAAVGLVAGLAVVACEMALRRRPLREILGAAAGLAAGLVLGWLAAQVVEALLLPLAVRGVVTAVVVLAACYLGLVFGARRGGRFSWPELLASLKESEEARPSKVLDTSVIIDGRIADIVEAGFIDSKLIIPSFVLQELQAVADSSDPLKRNRGRKGLDVLRDLKRSKQVEVEITEIDFPDVRDVDQKLIELGRLRGAPIVTNDFNLNKVAQLRGVKVLNINDLANALKPVVLPGENLEVFLVKEGKEQDQAVAYLDDGTMVVVDGARHLIGTKIEVIVTSHLQTSAGKMIFGIWKEDDERRQAIRRRKAE